MKKIVIRLAYVILGFSIGLTAAIKFTNKVSSHRTLYILAFVIIAIAIALALEISLDVDSKKIFGIVFCWLLSYPLAIIYQYLFAVVIFLLKAIKLFFKITAHIWWL